jgi:hypothetical protein
MKRLNGSQVREIIKDAQTGASLNQLSSKFGFPKTTIYYHVREFCRKMGKFGEKQLSEWEKGYLVGFFIGDGCWIFRPKYYSYITKFALNAKSEKPISNFLVTILQKAHTRPWVIIKGNSLDLRVSSKDLCSFLREYAGYETEDDKPRKRLLLENVQTEKFMFGILAGLLDSDGCVTTDKAKYLRAMISTRSKILAVTILQLAKRLGIKATIHKSSGYTVRVSTPFLKVNAQRILSLKLKQKFNWNLSHPKMVGP